MIHDVKVLHEPWRTWIINWYAWCHRSIIHYFEMQVLRMVRVVLGVRFAVWSLYLAFHNFLSSNTLSSGRKRISCLFSWFRNEKICDLLSIFSVHEPCQRWPLTPPVRPLSLLVLFLCGMILRLDKIILSPSLILVLQMSNVDPKFPTKALGNQENMRKLGLGSIFIVFVWG